MLPVSNCHNCGCLMVETSLDEAISEYNRNFNEDERDDGVLVCDDCYEEMMIWINSLSPSQLQDLKNNQ